MFKPNFFGGKDGTHFLRALVFYLEKWVGKTTTYVVKIDPLVNKLLCWLDVCS